MSLSKISRHDTKIDPYIDVYAERTSNLTVSAVRALFAVANQPEVVSLAGGMPNIADLPLTSIADSLATLIKQNGVKAMQYGSGQGEEFMRQHMCEVMSLEGIESDADNIVVSNGSQQGLDLVTRILCNPNDVVLVEAPSYVGALGTFHSYQTEIIHVPMDDFGLDPQSLRDIVTKLRRSGKVPKFLYTIPNFNNPSGILQPFSRRKEIFDTCQDLNILIVEDNPYGLLNFDSDLVPAIRSLSDQGIIYLGTFSKTFAPGFRVGWILAPETIRAKLVLAQESASLCPAVFSQFVISNYLENNDWQTQISSFKKMYRQRRDAMLSALKEYMPMGVSWTKPSGGFFVWVTLPEGLDCEDMLPRAISSRVAFTPGTAFYANGDGAENIRLSFCYPPPDSIRTGIQRLAEVIDTESDIHRTFGISAKQTHHAKVNLTVPRNI